MEKNPFNELIYQIKEISKSNITENKILNIGVVISPLPDLIIKTSNIKLDKDNLMIDKWLLDRHSESQTYTKGDHDYPIEDIEAAGGMTGTMTGTVTGTVTGTTDTITGTVTGTVTGTMAGSTEDGYNSYKEEHLHESKDYVNKLNVGDRVVMLRDGDMFYVISKVVSIDG